MAGSRSTKENKLIRQIEEAHKALAVEDLGEVLKWVLVKSSRVDQPLELLTDDWGIRSTNLYQDAKVTDARYGDTSYCSQLDDIAQEIRALSNSHRVRPQSGLVLILRQTYTSQSEVENTLKHAGFLTKSLDYGALLIDERPYADMLNKKERKKLMKRERYIGIKVVEILSQNPSVILSPLFESLGDTYDIQEDPLLQPEGVIIHRKLQEKASTIGTKPISFIGINDSYGVREQWEGYGIPNTHIKPHHELLNAVKKTLDINYQPISHSS